jgi:hypothetical protein
MAFVSIPAALYIPAALVYIDEAVMWLMSFRKRSDYICEAVMWVMASLQSLESILHSVILWYEQCYPSRNWTSILKLWCQYPAAVIPVGIGLQYCRCDVSEAILTRIGLHYIMLWFKWRHPSWDMMSFVRIPGAVIMRLWCEWCRPLMDWATFLKLWCEWCHPNRVLVVIC